MKSVSCREMQQQLQRLDLALHVTNTPPTNPAEAYLLALSEGNGRNAQRSGLARIARWFIPRATIETFPWSTLRWEHMQLLRAHLARTYAPATGNRMLSAVRGALRCAWRMGSMTIDAFERACEVERITGRRLLRGRAVPAHELRALFVAASRDKRWRRGLRDAALIALLFGGGLRRAEASGLNVEHLLVEEGRWFVVVLGKGNKQRRVPLPSSAAKVIERYLDNARGREAGPLFIGRHGRGRLKGPSIRLVLLNLVARARVPHLTAHDLRRSYISELFDAGADVAAVQGLAGHEQATTTVLYDRRGERARVKACDLLFVPAI